MKNSYVPPNLIGKNNSESLAKIWPFFVNFKERAKSELPFLSKHIERKDSRIFDASLGSGATSVGLKLAGFKNVVSNEIDKDFANVARQQAAAKGVKLEITAYDWKDEGILQAGKFNIVLCLGNSLTCLFGSENRLAALRNFNALLEKNGKLIIDERNYAYHFANAAKNFKFSGKVVYCGKDKVECKPQLVSQEEIVMRYSLKSSHLKAYIRMYPFKANEVQWLLKEANFKDIQVFGDYKGKFEKQEPEFLTYVAHKS